MTSHVLPEERARESGSERGLPPPRVRRDRAPLGAQSGPAGRGGSGRLLGLQRTAGNRAVVQLLSTSAAGPDVQREMDAGDNLGQAALAGTPIATEGATPALAEGETNEFGEQTGQLHSEGSPHVFVDNGKTGSALDNTLGGAGGSGDQGTGDITLVGPQYGSHPAAAGTPARAWILPGTGTATVTRSYHGSLTGANGPTLWMTAAAVARTDAHEVLHVQASRALHNTHIQPLEARIARHHTEATAMATGTTAADALSALQAFINWNATISAFRAADTAANRINGTVDTTDIASPTFLREYGPRRVNGVSYAHYFDVPPGPPAGPTAPP